MRMEQYERSWGKDFQAEGIGNVKPGAEGLSFCGNIKQREREGEGERGEETETEKEGT